MRKRAKGIPAAAFMASYSSPPRDRQDDAITAAFDRARETVVELEAKRIEATCPEWSPAQHAAVSK